MATITVSGLTFNYAGQRVLDGIDLSVAPGDRVAILSANGGGKTTLAQWLAGWLPGHGLTQAAGSVFYDGRRWLEWPLAVRCATVQLVGQIPAQHLSGRAFTVHDEIAFGPENLNLPPGEIRARVDAALETCRLTALAGRNPFSLSGGEQQRLVLAAALALRPGFIILDEPFTNLDPQSRDHVISVLHDLPTDTALVLMETNPSLALKVAREFALLDGGRIAVRGSAREVLLHPAAVEVAGLPAVSAAFRELKLGDDLATAQLPLTLGEVAALLHGRLSAC